MAEWVAPAQQYLESSWHSADFQFRWNALLSEREREVIVAFLKFRRDKSLPDGSFLNSLQQTWQAGGRPITTKQIERIREDALAKLGWEWSGIDQRARQILIDANRQVKQLLTLAEACMDHASAKVWKAEMTDALRETRERLVGANGSQKPLSQTLMTLFDRLRSGDFGMIPTAVEAFIDAYRNVLAEELSALQEAETERRQRELVESQIHTLIARLKKTDMVGTPIVLIEELVAHLTSPTPVETLTSLWPDVERLVTLIMQHHEAAVVHAAESARQLQECQVECSHPAAEIETLTGLINTHEASIRDIKRSLVVALEENDFSAIAMCAQQAIEREELIQALLDKRNSQQISLDALRRHEAELKERALILESVPIALARLAHALGAVLVDKYPEFLDRAAYDQWAVAMQITSAGLSDSIIPILV